MLRPWCFQLDRHLLVNVVDVDAMIDITKCAGADLLDETILVADDDRLARCDTFWKDGNSWIGWGNLLAMISFSARFICAVSCVRVRSIVSRTSTDAARRLLSIRSMNGVDEERYSFGQNHE